LLNRANSVAALLDRTMESASRIAHGLRPPLLDLGLPAAIEWEAREFQKRMEIPCTVTCTGEDIAIAPELATALFTCLHETLTNISKHAAATKVEVELGIDSSLVTLKVTDNGRGVVHTDLLKRGSFGLRGMRERARHLGGEISFAGKPGQGTTVTARLPLEPAVQPPLSVEMDSP
jgi:signal transduction histidine kinase